MFPLKKYGLIGKRLDHSFSKRYFTDKFEKENINASYENLETEDLTILKKVISKKEITGFNITIPYKKEMVSLANELSKAVQEIGATNCIEVNKKGNWIAHNTDVIGFEKSLLNLIKNDRPEALIFGTGGASEAVQYVLKKTGIKYQLVSRIKKDNCIQYQDLNKNILEENQLLINTTPLGTFPNVEDHIEIPYQFLSEKHFCFDLVYNPAKTSFLQRAEQQGATIKNGLEMLEIQAEESWKIWKDQFDN